MKNKFIEYFNRYTTLTSDEEKIIFDSMIIQEFKKGEFIQKEGQIITNTYFILSGCIREFINVDGVEKTTNFFTNDEWVISLNNFNSQSLTESNLICVEDTFVSVGNEEQARKMFKEFPRFETISRIIVEENFARQKKHLTTYLTDTPENRYLNLINNRPEIIQKVPQYEIASYIGVKPETLSRIRKRLTFK